MDLPQLDEWAGTKPQLKQSTLEKVRIFRWLVGSLFTLIAATFVLMLWVLSYGDSYQEHAAVQGPSSTWPDGSARTPQDSSWDKAKGQLAQPPAPPQPQSPNRG
ncbi:MAG: hypothetical protein JO128_16695 [Alphaproteobacteria bacterium]|nr:hypothetical protein [Alphaproteobacteria bacterium]